jgi:hypothetical protein
MNYFEGHLRGGGQIPRVHPLLLSLTVVMHESETAPNKAPNISSVREDDPWVLRSRFYTSPDNLPSLDIQFDGRNGAAQSPNHGSYLSITLLPAEKIWQLDH